MATNVLFRAVAADDPDLVGSVLNGFDDPGSSELQSLLKYQDTDTGNTMAHLAAAHSSTECLQLLIQYDIDVSRKNWEGLTPLGVAHMNGRVQAAELIKNNYIFEHKSSSSSSEAAIAANENGSSDDLVRRREGKCRAKVTRRTHPSALPSRPLMFEQRMKQERHETELKLRTVSAKTFQAWWRRRAEILLSSKR